ncbi:26408_t:CDS:2 [Dentiscutata erythropus]|uniref:26408_t:CDS:1 n=1 Tax=Dentiscutata erythropus TaxID=1348616 RepID=A0A9N8WIG6_9GLOM|nr:26408_t:CDS:2 [Dentiscutata erythropus]
MTCFYMVPTIPYLKDQIVGPDHQIISCNHIEVLDAWLNDWCKRVYRILSLCQYQYILNLVRKTKRKSMQPNKIVADDKNIKEDTTNNVKIVVFD